jgi:hypothetical protein
MNIWLDDIREAPIGYVHTHSVNETIELIKEIDSGIIFFDLDHDLGDYYSDGGDAIELIKWLIENGYNENRDYNFIFALHTMNPVGRENMQALIDRYFRK